MKRKKFLGLITTCVKNEIENRQYQDRTNGVVIGSVNALEKTGGTPTTAENDKCLLGRIKWELRAGVAILVCEVPEGTGRCRIMRNTC